MVKRTLPEKLALLADAAKYDASCASSGGEKRNSRDGLALGSSGGAGICHAWAPDGRCISLLKVLLTNVCIYDCAYCINRASSRVERARFTVEEVVSLTLEFYRRNYIEGLFLSSGIIRSSDDTMSEMIRVARTLREREHFRGYIHLKTIPDAAPELIAEAGKWADRLSINVELPTETALRQLAPEKSAQTIQAAMAEVKNRGEAARDKTRKGTKAPRFAPAGQSTQMIVGADPATDGQILGKASRLYADYALRRVYYSAFSPIPDASQALPPVSPPLAREHRLYQADWLMRNYGFAASEITPPSAMLDLEIDPKLAWALCHRGLFPVDVNRAPREMLLRIPGIGPRSVERILQARRHRSLRYEDLLAIGCVLRHAEPFITLPGWSPRSLPDDANLRARFAPPPRQLSLF